MARIRLRELLIPAAALLLVLGGPLPVRAQGYPDTPPFFEDPDPESADRIRDAIEFLKRPSASTRTRAREELVDIGYWAVAPLRKLIYDGTFSQRRSAGLVLGTILDPRGLPDLIRVAREDRQEFPPSFAALMIGKFRDPSTLPVLRELIRSGRKSHRQRSCVLAVAKIGHEKSYEVLEEVLRREKGILQESATFCLGFFRTKALVRAPGGVARPCDLLLAALRSRDENLRRSAMLALALLGHRDLKEIYERVVRDVREDAEIRRIALLALGRFPDADVTELVLAVLVNRATDSRVKEMAAMVLKDRKDPGVLETIKAFHPEDVTLRAALTLALSNFDDPEAVRLIIQRLWDTHDQVSAAAAIGLSRITDPEGKELAIRALDQALEQGVSDSDVRYDMRLARELLREKEPDGEFRWVGNRRFAEDLPKDIEERILDAVNNEVERILDIASLTQIKAARQDGRFRKDDESSELRDLEEYFLTHPYFEPEDIPEPEVAITPKPDR
jgi:HEAT repeat protein